MDKVVVSDPRGLLKKMWRWANSGVFDGINTNTRYFTEARWYIPNDGVLLLFTRDKGMHDCGWFKNPDYNQCYHLSISCWNPITRQPAGYDPKLHRQWIHMVYGDWVKYIWHESPVNDNPSQPHHYRVMTDSNWQPIIPRGEVYTKEYTALGWKSWSDQQYESGLQ